LTYYFDDDIINNIMIERRKSMLNLSKDDVRLLLCALKDAGAYNNHLLETDDSMSDDDKEECRVAVVDYDAMYKKVKFEW
jgi:hypothetical protein